MALDGRDPIALAQALVQCPSVTPHEGGALALLARVLGEAGFEVHRPVFSAAGTPDVENLYARIGRGRPCILFAGHTDVVPVGDPAKWRFAPFAGAIVEGRLYGRGACDMKGGVAASVAAALRRIATSGGPDEGSIAFLVTGDEEGPAVNGTVKLLAWAHERGERFDACILGEPTNSQTLGDTVKVGRRGSLTGRLTVEGRQGHVAYPHLADNPIPGLLRLIDALTATPLDAGTAHFDPSNIEVTTIDVGNGAANLIPASAQAVFNIRFCDVWTPESLEAEIRARLAAAAGNRLSYDLSFAPTNATAFLTPPGPLVELLRGAVKDVTGRSPAISTTGGTSDARFIKDYCPVVEFGLVGQTMHQVDEHASLADIEGLTEIYHRLLDRFLARDTQPRH